MVLNSFKNAVSCSVGVCCSGIEVCFLLPAHMCIERDGQGWLY